MDESINHPHGGKTIVGRLLEPGDELNSGDVYTSLNGTWNEPNCVENIVVGPSDECSFIYVRPQV